MATIQPFSGTEQIDATAAKTWAVISCPEILASCVPGLVSAEPQADKSLKCVIRPQLSFLGGSLKATISVEESTPMTRQVMRIDSSAIGMTLSVRATLELAAAGEGASTLNWHAEVIKMTGLVAALPEAVIRGAAERTIRDGLARVKARAESQANAS